MIRNRYNQNQKHAIETETGENWNYRHNTKILVDLILNVPVNNFSVMLGRSHQFLGITSTFGE